MPRFSVIVPVYSQPELLAACLASIRRSKFLDFELIVSDDGSPDSASIQRVAVEYEARLVRGERRSGSAAARNRAVAVASGRELVFVDADVTVTPETLSRFAEDFDSTPAPDAVIGSYDAEPGGRNRTSHFRNLLHTHAHMRSGPHATTFWTGCGAITRACFGRLGGFQESFDRPSIEDVELGLRLHRSGGRILLDRRIQVKHHKDWDLREMLWTDLTCRAIPWAALIREHGLPHDLNFRMSDRLAVAFTALAVPLAVLAILHGALFGALLGACVAGVALLQSSLLKLLAKSKGIAFALTSFPLLLLYNLTCAAGLIAGLLCAERRRDPWFVAALATCAAVILAFQFAGGAYRAEFTGSPDEPAQFVSSLMVYDYVTILPHANPLSWAKNYYLHYPKVAIGHWPPLYFMMEAGWWLLFPPSRGSAMALNALLLLIAAGIFYHRVRDAAPGWLALAAAVALLATPVVQQSAEQSMAESTCLLWSVLLLDALARLVRRPSAGMMALAGLWLACAVLTKGTGFCMALAPVVALAIAGKWGALGNRRVIGFGIAVLLLGIAWYGVQIGILYESIAKLGGIGWSLPSLGTIGGLAGYGILALAAIGGGFAIVRRRPAAVASAAMLISVVASAAVLSAMSEPRHFILLIPALVLLAVEASARMPKAAGIACLIAAAALAPWHLYRQSPAGFVSASARLNLPGRMMISSGGEGEGAWIAEVALKEKRPASVIARASKVLTHSNWNGGDYTLLVQTPGEVERMLDELAIDSVIIDEGTAENLPPHRALLEEAMKSSPSWKSSSAEGELVVYQRVRPPTVPRRPLELDLRDKIGAVIEEQ